VLASAEIQSVLNGLTLLPCTFIYAKLTNDFKTADIVTILNNARTAYASSEATIMALNIIVLIGFVLNFKSAHNIAFNFGNPGDHSKLKQLLIILGVPLFTVIFMANYLFGGMDATPNKTSSMIGYGPKILLEVLFICFAYFELNEIEKEHKDQVDTRATLSKALTFAKSRNGAFNEYWATLSRGQEISWELGVGELKRIAIDAFIATDPDVFQCSSSN
jgi:hypothetical protein